MPPTVALKRGQPHDVAPQPAARRAAASSAANQPHSCTNTSSGSCIQGGEFCPQASEGQTGYDADGTPYVCRDSDNDGHPHWENA